MFGEAARLLRPARLLLLLRRRRSRSAVRPLVAVDGRDLRLQADGGVGQGQDGHGLALPPQLRDGVGGPEGRGKTRWYDTTNKVENIIRDIPKIIPGEDDHPTPKPLPLIHRFMRWHATAGDLVLDPFMGHGGVLEAARLHGCRAIGIDVNEEYCERAAKALAQGVLFGAEGAA
jgi:hypothetical protein